jgi:RNA polymerase sigma factor (sigma-70 family)
MNTHATIDASALAGPLVDRDPKEAIRSSEWTDAQLVCQCLRGNDEAWKALLEKYKRLIYSIPIKYGLSQDEATEIFQETCVELLEALPKLREPRALPKWLMQVAAHKCARLKARDRRHQHVDYPDGDTALDLMADGNALSDELMCGVERAQALRDAVSELPPRCRELVRLLFFETPARPYKEIAERLKLSSGSIGFIRGRCLQCLRAQLRTKGFR